MVFKRRTTAEFKRRVAAAMIEPGHNAHNRVGEGSRRANAHITESGVKNRERQSAEATAIEGRDVRDPIALHGRNEARVA